MLGIFGHKSTRSPAEAALAGWGIDYRKLADGTIVVDGDLDLTDQETSELPDLSQVRVKGFLLLNQASRTNH